MNTHTNPITVTAFRWVPPFAQGLVRDLRVRWALEEAGLPYTAKLIGPEDQASAEYREWQPFGQVPAFAQDGLELFESGAIVLHIAEQSEALMPNDAAGRARVKTWLFAALNSIEPAVQELTVIDLFHSGAEWTKARRPQVEDRVRSRLGALAAWLGERDYLEGRYTAADLLMVTVLRNLRHTDLLTQVPTIKAYCERCEARPAFQKALRDQLADFVEHPPAA
ncbi:glutathione S-transferase family protein [Hydrocarboniphaga sp.]|uniref:glutathione S-transferase family protein n=1 Tax=Hydrocarboniphaga sp. TaxID=2033016 RepID=UPI00260DC6E8|nr:glutathione S-transferase family protein [Hydrocarboniphaga sp.]